MAQPTPATNTLPHSPGMSVTLKIALVLISIGTLATLATALMAYFLFSSIQKETVQNNLSSIRALLENRLAAYTDTLRLDAQSLAQSPSSLQIILFKASGTTDDNVQASLKIFQNNLIDHRKRLRYHDIYLCEPNGRVLFNTLEPQSEVPNSSLLSSLAQEITRNNQPTLLSSERGVERGGNTLNEASLLVAAPILNGDTVIAMLVIETSLAPINSIMTFNSRPQEVGLAQTGEAYLVDAKSLPRTALKNPSPSTVSAEITRNALSGNTATEEYENYSGKKVLGAYNRLKIDGLPWFILVEQEKSEALQPARSAAFTIAGIGLVILLLVGISGFFFAKMFAKPIVNLEETIRRVSAGDESARAIVENNDEIGQVANALNEMIVERNGVKDRISTENKRVQANIQDFLLVVADASEGKLAVRAKRTEGLLGNVADALNRMLENVSTLIGEAKGASSQVQESAGEIASAALNLADGATSQTQQISQTIAEVQNLAAEAQGVSENSHEAAQAASRTRQAAEDGAKAVRDVVAYMERLQESVQTNAQKITRLGERSQEISGIVRSISEISAETDVLAMNASIEAARAGEQGKGFTVVADQVRALADRTRQATVEIEKLVLNIQSETAEAVKQMERANIEVENGTRQVSSAGASLSNIVEASVDSSTLANQIRQSASQQEQRAQAMLQAIVAINQIAEDTRNRTLDFRETSDLLATLAKELNKQLDNFEVG
jgi:methyl-accepting chemotaxis protein